MSLTKQEIIDWASRYVQEDEVTDFPHNGDIFCLLIRDIPTDKVLKEEEGWKFNGYGVCLGYTLDEDSKPLGKWIWMNFATLETFPPSSQVIKLQPPHIIKGRFFTPQRDREIRILKMNLMESQNIVETDLSAEQAKQSTETKSDQNNVVQFRKKS
ncbi:hypothetical protein CHISP_2353 [Chitinispirillum alkaliphilum]|nr:hypothetical protein CHISP_2353 [Chitinispirillum alkaliphilum]